MEDVCSLFLIRGLVHVLLSHSIDQNSTVKDYKRVCNIISVNVLKDSGEDTGLSPPSVGTE